MSAVTTDEVANAFIDLAAEVGEALRKVGPFTRPAITGDYAARIFAAACLTVSQRLLDGVYGP